MSGHNKFSKIKRLKAKNDSQKSKVFSKIVKLLSAEAKKANGNVESPGLRTAILKAKEVNMPGDNIDRTIKKAVGETSAQMDSIVYECYGPGGVAIMIDVLTDNRNRAAGEVKHILSLNGSSLAASGSASWAFDKTAEGWVPKMTTPISDEDAAKLEIFIDALEDNDDVQEVYTNAE